MANTVSNLLYVSGSLPDRDRLVGGIIRAGGSDALLRAHAGGVWMKSGPTEKSDPSGYIYDVVPSHTDGYTAFRFFSYSDSHLNWMASVAAHFPSLTFELLVGSVGQFVAYFRYEDGRQVENEAQPDYKAREFCRRHGWTGWWTPLWDEEEEREWDGDPDLPVAGQVERDPAAFASSAADLPTVLDFPADGPALEDPDKRDTTYPEQQW